MRQILQQILKSNQIVESCLLLTDGTWIWGKVQTVTEDLVWFTSSCNEKTGRHWTTVIKIDCIQAIDFRSDVRPVTGSERELLGLPVEEN